MIELKESFDFMIYGEPRRRHINENYVIDFENGISKDEFDIPHDDFVVDVDVTIQKIEDLDKMFKR